MTGNCHYSFQRISVVDGYAGSSNKEETLGISIRIQILFPRVKEGVTVVVRDGHLGLEAALQLKEMLSGLLADY